MLIICVPFGDMVHCKKKELMLLNNGLGKPCSNKWMDEVNMLLSEWRDDEWFLSIDPSKIDNVIIMRIFIFKDRDRWQMYDNL
jgi:hypothetical protein